MTGCTDDSACNLAVFSLLKNRQICLIYKQHLDKSIQASIFIAKKKKTAHISIYPLHSSTWQNFQKFCWKQFLSYSLTVWGRISSFFVADLLQVFLATIEHSLLFLTSALLWPCDVLLKGEVSPKLFFLHFFPLFTNILISENDHLSIMLKTLSG